MSFTKYSSERWGFGMDDLLMRNESKRVSLQFTVVNVTNKEAMYNCLSTFGGTHFVQPRLLAHGIVMGGHRHKAFWDNGLPLRLRLTDQPVGRNGPLRARACGDGADNCRASSMPK
jgi:hypothetical protein